MSTIRPKRSPKRNSQASRGFTLIEMMVTIAILGILMGLAWMSWDKASSRNGSHNAALDFMATLSKARARAIDRNERVWVLVYPTITSSGASGGNGGYYLIEDPDLSFKTTGYSTFDPSTTSTQVATAPSTWKVMSRTFLNDYPKQNVKFGTTVTPAAAYPAPFNGITPTSCSFCTGTPSRGAIVFQGTGAAWFLDSTGALQSADVNGTATVASRTATLGISATTTNAAYLFAVSGPTGFVGYYPLP